MKKFISPVYGKPKVIYLGNIDADFNFGGETSSSNSINQSTSTFSSNEETDNSKPIRPNDEIIEDLVEEIVEKVITEKTIYEGDQPENMTNHAESSIERKDIAARVALAEKSVASKQTENSPLVLTKSIETSDEAETENADSAINPLDGLGDTVRATHQEYQAHVKMGINRSLI
jgi:hypothetical protein